MALTTSKMVIFYKHTEISLQCIQLNTWRPHHERNLVQYLEMEIPCHFCDTVGTNSYTPSSFQLRCTDTETLVHYFYEQEFMKKMLVPQYQHIPSKWSTCSVKTQWGKCTRFMIRFPHIYPRLEYRMYKQTLLLLSSSLVLYLVQHKNHFNLWSTRNNLTQNNYIERCEGSVCCYAVSN